MGTIEELEVALEEEKNIEDEALLDEDESVSRYDITSYGIDFDVEGLVKRVKRGDIFIPSFQRNFVWKLTESSRLIESLLLGLPVPGIFLAQEAATGKMLVIDGQQRLLSLLYFFAGVFKPVEGESRQRTFRLTKVQPQYDGKTFEDLDSKERINLENCVIHATVVKQDSPANEDTSIYHIFERLNSGGRKLAPQEIRSAVYHGGFIDLIKDLNEHPSWRNIYGRINDRMKDQELIIRYFSMLEAYEAYAAPMTNFINQFTKKYRCQTTGVIEEYADYFKQCCDLFLNSIESRPFRRVTAINVAFYESAMVALTEKIKRDGVPGEDFVKEKYNQLKEDHEFAEATSQSTGNKASVVKRMNRAKIIFLGE